MANEQQSDKPDSFAPVDLWASGMADCLSCGWRWYAVWPLAADLLECKKCGSADTEREQE